MEKKNEITDTALSLSRRKVLKLWAFAGAGLLLSSKLDGSKARAQVPDFCPDKPPLLDLTPFVDDLPIPPRLEPEKRRRRRTSHYYLSANQFLYSYHRDLPEASVWGFNGMTLGPTIETRRDPEIRVTIANDLESYILCPDLDVHGAWPEPYITIHGHGLVDRQEDDGFPEDRFPREVMQIGTDGGFLPKPVDLTRPVPKPAVKERFLTLVDTPSQ